MGRSSLVSGSLLGNGSLTDPDPTSRDMYPLIPGRADQEGGEGRGRIIQGTGPCPGRLPGTVAICGLDLYLAETDTRPPSLWVHPETLCMQAEDRFVIPSNRCTEEGRDRVRFGLLNREQKSWDSIHVGSTAETRPTLCETVANADYVQEVSGGARWVRLVARDARPGAKGKVYLRADAVHQKLIPDDDAIRRRAAALCAKSGMTVPSGQSVAASRWRD